MTEPGSFYVRPSREDAEKSEHQFYILIKAMRGRVDLPLKRIAELVGLPVDKPGIEKEVWRRIDEKRLSQSARDFILRHIFDTANVVTGKLRREAQGIDHALFFSMLNFFSAKDTSQDKARIHLEGTYKFWRFAADHPDEFLFGKMVFAEDPETRALTATLVQQKKPYQGEKGLKETFSGYLFRLSHMYFILFHNEKTNDLRTTLLPTFKVDDVGTQHNPNSVYAGSHRHAVYLDGFGLGIDGARGFFSPVHLSLVDDVTELDALDDQLDVVREGDPRLPDRVVAMLRSNGPLRRL